MKKIIILTAISLILLAYVIEPTDSRRLSGRKKERKEKKEEKSDADEADEEEDITEDLKNLELNATMSCYKCTSPSCTKTKVDCDPGQICWKGKTIDAEFKGCASRFCIPIDDHSNVSIITSNICCISDYCNSAKTIYQLFSFIPLFFCSLIVFFNKFF